MTTEILGLVTPKVVHFSYIIYKHTLNLDHVCKRHAQYLVTLILKRVQKWGPGEEYRCYSLKQKSSIVP